MKQNVGTGWRGATVARAWRSFHDAEMAENATASCRTEETLCLGQGRVKRLEPRGARNHSSSKIVSDGQSTSAHASRELRPGRQVAVNSLPPSFPRKLRHVRAVSPKLSAQLSRAVSSVPAAWIGSLCGEYRFVGRAASCYNLAVRALAIGYVFVVAALAGLAVRMAYRLQLQFRQPWLPPYVFYLASWGALVLLSVVQYLLIGSFLPDSAWNQLMAATRPLFMIALGVALYFLSSFMVQLTGGRLSRAYVIAYVTVWTAAGVAISVGGALIGNPSRTLANTASFVAFALKAGTMYGWIAYGLLAIRRIEDPLERTGLRRFVLLQLGGFLAFDLAVRDVTAAFGVHATDVVISLAQVGMNYPALLWAGRFLGRRALARPAEPLPADLKPELVGLGLSARESDVVELVLAGLSHKEVADRLSISPDTVKKHTYNAYRKLGVQNRLQLSYFVLNRVPRRS